MQATDKYELARAKLRERLGAGARYDSPAAPVRELLWARRGTAYFARKLNQLSDEQLDLPSRVRGWSRRHVVAHVGYHARALSRLVEGARKGERRETVVNDVNEDVDFGSTLPPHALRYLFQHSEVHLNVEWRDLGEAGWAAEIEAHDGRAVAIVTTPFLRAKTVWMSALDLAADGSLDDLPPDFRHMLRGQ